jgi:hypothetical protein
MACLEKVDTNFVGPSGPYRRNYLHAKSLTGQRMSKQTRPHRKNTLVRLNLVPPTVAE